MNRLLLPPLALACIAASPAERVASGAFTVKVTPAVAAAGDPIPAMVMEKTLSGDLVGTSTGRMLYILDPKTGVGGYVAVERVTASLGGRSGGFALMHRGTTEGGLQALDIRVVPGSGTGGLAGSAGAMDITVAGGRHDYRFRYTLPG